MTTYFDFIPIELKIVIGSAYISINVPTNIHLANLTNLKNILDILGIKDYKELYYSLII